MPTRKIRDLAEENCKGWELEKDICQHPEHNPPMHRVYEPGVWEHECPGCGKKQIFTVPRITCGLT